MQYRLIPATAEDQRWLEALRRSVYQELFAATWGGWDEARHLRHWAKCWERGNIFIVELDGERVGMIQLFEGDDALEVGEIQIQPKHQGRGIGSRLLQDTLARAHAKGKKISLATGLQNHRAVRLYEHLGFQHVSQSETHFHMESEPEALPGDRITDTETVMTENGLDIGNDIHLTKVQPGDSEELFRLVVRNREYLKQWMPWAHTTDSVEDTAAFIGRSVQQDAEGRGFQCCIHLEGSGIVGVVGHVNINHADRKTELGYWIAEEYQGRGIVSRAVRALVDHAFLVLNLNRIEIRAAQTNVRSRAIAERLGFRLEGTLRQNEWVNSRYVDHAVYGLLRREWEPRS